MKPVRALALAEAEADRAFDWYENQSELAAAGFSAELQEAFLGICKNPLKWIVHEGRSYVLHCGPLSFTIHQADQRYDAYHDEPTELHRRFWQEHKAWTAIDLPRLRTARLRSDGSLGMFYRILTIYAFLFWSPNCLGVYFPAERVSIPNLGDLADSINWARRIGQNLDFLDSPKRAKC